MFKLKLTVERVGICNFFISNITEIGGNTRPGLLEPSNIRVMIISVRSYRPPTLQHNIVGAIVNPTGIKYVNLSFLSDNILGISGSLAQTKINFTTR